MLIYATKHLDYQNKLNHADVALADGVGLFFAAGFKGEQLRDRITGVDFIESICKEAKEKPISMGFLGGKDGVAELAAKRLKKKYPWLNIIFISKEWDTKTKISPIDILFVAFAFGICPGRIYPGYQRSAVSPVCSGGVGGDADFGS